MSRSRDVPKSVRIRTDPDENLAHRYRSISEAQTALETSTTTETVVRSCDLVAGIVEELPAVLEELPPDKAEQLADRLSRRGLEIDYEPPSADIRTR